MLRPVTNQSYSTVQLMCYNYNNNYTVPAQFCSRQEHRFLCQVTSQFHCSHTPAEPAAAKQSTGKQQSWSWSKVLPASIAVTETKHTSACPPHLSRLGRLRKLKSVLAEMDGAVSHRAASREGESPHRSLHKGLGPRSFKRKALNCAAGRAEPTGTWAGVCISVRLPGRGGQSRMTDDSCNPGPARKHQLKLPLDLFSLKHETSVSCEQCLQSPSSPRAAETWPCAPAAALQPHGKGNVKGTLPRLYQMDKRCFQPIYPAVTSTF